MVVVTVTEAKNRLSALIDRARAGETVLIVDRGIPVARLTGAPSERPDDLDGRIARLERAGLVRRPSGLPPPALPVEELPQPRNRASVVEALLEERRSGR
jgi:prevent-host-death family protein